MTRMYIQPSFVNSCSDHGEWSGGNGQYRGDKSAHIATFDKQGRARVGAFSDEAIEALKPKKKSSLTIQQKILPQASRVERLTEQMKELVSEYKAGNIDIDEYSMLLSVISTKRERSIQLLAKAKSVRAPFEIEEEEVVCLGKTHIKNEKSFKTSKRTGVDTACLLSPKKPKKDNRLINRSILSKTLTFLAKNDWAVFVGSSTLLFTLTKIIF